MSSEYQVRGYQQGEENKIIPLLASAFGLWPNFDVPCTASEHWRWRYRDKRPGLITIIQYEDMIASCNHATLDYYRINGDLKKTAYITDTAVDLEHRGKGLYKIVTNSISKLGEEAGVHFTYTMTSNPILEKSRTLRQTWPYSFPFTTSLLSQIVDINQHIKANGIKLGVIRRFKEWINHVLASPIKEVYPNIHVSEVKLFDSRVIDFLKKINKGYDFIQNRTKDYLNWRYCDPRGGNYKIKIVEEGGALSGYIVCRIFKVAEYHHGYIVDLLTIDNRLDVAEVLLVSAMKYFMENKINITSYQVIKNHPFEALFKKYGFMRRNDPRKIFINYSGLELDRISPHRIHFPFGDLPEL